MHSLYLLCMIKKSWILLRIDLKSSNISSLPYKFTLFTISSLNISNEKKRNILLYKNSIISLLMSHKNLRDCHLLRLKRNA